MGASWRPSNWKNPHKDYWGKEMTLKEDYETNQHFSYEAGADAMLEALKKDAAYMNGDTIIPAQGKCPEIHCPGGMVGWLVFIPDKE